MSDITWTNVRVALGELKPWERNPRFSTKTDAQNIIKSFNDFGQVETIAIGPDNEVYNGHQRLSALLAEHGPKYSIDARRSSRNLTEDERERLTIYLHGGAGGSFDWDQISSWDASKLIDNGLNQRLLKSLKTDIGALGSLLASEKENSSENEVSKIDQANQLLEKWGVEVGQLWSIGPHRLLCGDAFLFPNIELLMSNQKANMLLNDPPYGKRLDADFSDMVNHPGLIMEGVKDGNEYESVIGDDVDFDAFPIFGYFEYCKEQFWWGADYYSASLIDTMHQGAWLVWDKRLEDGADKMYGSCFELLWSRQKHKRDIFRYKWVARYGTEKEAQRGRLHPNQKPVVLYEDIITRYSDKGWLIVDCFAGSGTTFEACQKLGRACYALELSPVYCSVILERMSKLFPDIEIKKIS